MFKQDQSFTITVPLMVKFIVIQKQVNMRSPNINSIFYMFVSK